jgi:hypothetical protein
MSGVRLSRRIGLTTAMVALLSIAACGSNEPPRESGAPSSVDSGTPCVDCGDATTDAGSPGTTGAGGLDANPAADAADAADAAQDVIGDRSGVTAVRAVDFLASLGVCVHIAQGVDSAQPVATAMTYAGIRNLRDDGRPSAVSAWITVHQATGALVNMLPNSDIPTTIEMAKQLVDAGALLSVEGPNEPNNFPVTYGGATSSYTGSFVPVANFQRDLYAAVRAEPSLDGIPVFHSSEAGGAEPDNVGLQYLIIPPDAGTTMPTGTRYAEYANTHNYVCGHSNQLVDNVCWNASDPTLNGDWDGTYVEYGHTWHGHFAGYSNADLMTLPRVTTETGWVTSGTGAITEPQQGRLFLNLYLAAFKRGWAYTFIYMLRDDPNQGYWGLFDTSYTAKASGTYLHNLTAILADAGGRSPGRLEYTIAAEPSTVHDLLMQKSSGLFELVVWDERPGGGSDGVVVDLGSSRASVKVYDPTTGTAAIQAMSGVSSVPLTLTDHPVILEL